VDFADVVANVAADARFEAEAAGRRVHLDSVEHAMVRGRAELLHRAVENVVRNAVKHTEPGTAVEITLLGQAGKAILSVRDHGPGVASSHLERIFEPFYRVDGKGFGLGLAIAQAAVLAHGGSISAANPQDGGLRIDIQLPSL
jgi:signal transduction histidine kinase